MRRRKSRVDTTPGEVVTRPEPDEVATAWDEWDEWDERWERPEAERVVRWLRSKGAGAGGLHLDPSDWTAPEEAADSPSSDEQAQPSDGDGGVPPGPGRVGALGAGIAEMDWPPTDRNGSGPSGGLRDVRPHTTAPQSALPNPHPEEVRTATAALEQEQRSLVAAVEELRAELGALDEQRRQSAAALVSQRAAIAALEDEHQRLVDAMEAERRDRRARMIADFEADQSEISRVREHQRETSSRLEREISVLETRIRELSAEAQEASAEAERSRAAERHARAGLEAGLEEARRREAQHFEQWIALDAEVTSLQARLDELREVACHRGSAPGRLGEDPGPAVRTD